jgi:enoyl-[acyl-carrier protein] reductase I
MSDKPLSGKTAVVFGVANKRSIAWAIAKAWADAGANLIFNYQGERLKDNVEQLAATFGDDVPLYPCDVTSDETLDAFFKRVQEHTDTIDLVLHSVAFAPKEALEGDFLTTTRDAFKTSHDISAYSLVALAQRAAPMMTNGGSIVAMSYYGAAKVVPNYNVMGVAKSSSQLLHVIFQALTLVIKNQICSGIRPCFSNCPSYAPLVCNSKYNCCLSTQWLVAHTEHFLSNHLQKQ